jgi:hypothetical protein
MPAQAPVTAPVTTPVPDKARDRRVPRLEAKEAQIEQWRQACLGLKSEGEALAHRLRFMDTDKAGRRVTDKAYKEVTDWLKRYEDYRALWYSGVMRFESLTEKVTESFFWTPVPGPDWRAAWVTAIEAKLRKLGCEPPPND